MIGEIERGRVAFTSPVDRLAAMLSLDVLATPRRSTTARREWACVSLVQWLVRGDDILEADAPPTEG